MTGENNDIDNILTKSLSKNMSDKYVTREEFNKTIDSINVRINTIYEALKELKAVTREQNMKLIDMMRENNDRMQSEITKLLTTMLQSKNDIVRETIRSKDIALKQQNRLTLTVLKYELAKGGFAGLIISAFLLILKVSGII